MNEIELKFLDIDPQAIEEKLQSLGAEKVYDHVFEEWILQKPEWKSYRGRVRVRSEKDAITLAYKETTRSTAEGNTEIEFTVSDKQSVLAFLEKLEISIIRHQQKRRIHFILDEVSIDIDFWPEIPPLLELEAASLKQIEAMVKKLGLSLKESCDLDALQVIQDRYNIDVTNRKEYLFKK